MVWSLCSSPSLLTSAFCVTLQAFNSVYIEDADQIGLKNIVQDLVTLIGDLLAYCLFFVFYSPQGHKMF